MEYSIIRHYEYKEFRAESQLPDYPKFSLPEGAIVIDYDYYQGWDGDILMQLKVLIPTKNRPNENTNKEEKG